MKRVGLILFTIGVLGCASTPKPTTALTEAKAAARSAHELGASEQPSAALHLKLANDEIAAAEALMKKADYRKAKRSLERARVDAELALLLTRAAEKQAEAEAATAALAQISEEMQSPTSVGEPGEEDMESMPQSDEPSADEPSADEPSADVPNADEPNADEPSGDESQ